MTDYGKYNPENTHNTSVLFTYKETPLTSSKLNRWNGNIEAAFEVIHHVCSRVFAQGNSALIGEHDKTVLKVIAAETPNMTVQINPGWAAFNHGFAGLKEAMQLPEGGFFQPPQTNPRIDRIVLNENGHLQIIEGQESEEPQSPECPEASLSLATIFHRIGAIQILEFDDGEQSYIIDDRPSMLLGEAHKHALDRIPEESPNGIRTEFSTAHFYRPATLDVYLNGILLEKGIDYVENEDHLHYTFADPPLTHYHIQHRYLIDQEISEI